MQRTTTRFLAAALMVGAFAAPSALAQGEGEDRRSERAKGAPGLVCKAQGAQPGSAAWGECIALAAKARARAGDGAAEADPSARGEAGRRIGQQRARAARG